MITILFFACQMFYPFYLLANWWIDCSTITVFQKWCVCVHILCFCTVPICFGLCIGRRKRLNQVQKCLSRWNHARSNLLPLKILLSYCKKSSKHTRNKKRENQNLFSWNIYSSGENIKRHCFICVKRCVATCDISEGERNEIHLIWMCHS